MGTTCKFSKKNRNNLKNGEGVSEGTYKHFQRENQFPWELLKNILKKLLLKFTECRNF